jgi:hypothetical protein
MPVRLGALKLVVHVPKSKSPRKVELRWARTTRLKGQDPRRVSAFLSLFGFLPAPSALERFPDDLHNSGLDYGGIWDDGWLSKHSYGVLAAGGPTNLAIRAQVPPTGGAAKQHLRVRVGGRTLVSKDILPGLLELGIPLPASARDRRIDLLWAHVGRLSAKDPRRASARLLLLGYAPPPATLNHFPADLLEASVSTSGIYKDGWLQKEGRVLLKGGSTGRLTLRAEVTNAVRSQHLDVLVNGKTVASTNTPAGPLELHAAIGKSNHPRQVELRWRTTARIGPNDPRRAAALLKFISVAPT